MARPKFRLTESWDDLIPILRCFLLFQIVISSRKHHSFQIYFSWPNYDHPGRARNLLSPAIRWWALTSDAARQVFPVQRHVEFGNPSLSSCSTRSYAASARAAQQPQLHFCWSQGSSHSACLCCSGIPTSLPACAATGATAAQPACNTRHSSLSTAIAQPIGLGASQGTWLLPACAPMTIYRTHSEACW